MIYLFNLLFTLPCLHKQLPPVDGLYYTKNWSELSVKQEFTCCQDHNLVVAGKSPHGRVGLFSDTKYFHGNK